MVRVSSLSSLLTPQKTRVRGYLRRGFAYHIANPSFCLSRSKKERYTLTHSIKLSRRLWVNGVQVLDSGECGKEMDSEMKLGSR